MSPNQEYRAIIRIAGTDCDGSRRVDHAISRIRGVGTPFARAVLKAAEIPLNSRLGYLTEGEIKRIEEIMASPVAHGIPEWMVNRPRSPETGKGYHVIGSDLDIRTRMDIDVMKKMRSWKGVRHSLGLKVRGQRTKTTARTGRTLGVSRKAITEAARAAQAAQSKEKKE
jgi:small subunit ribosomal protein S13